jgi:hypothetical protein
MGSLRSLHSQRVQNLVQWFRNDSTVMLKWMARTRDETCVLTVKSCSDMPTVLSYQTVELYVHRGSSLDNYDLLPCYKSTHHMLWAKEETETGLRTWYLDLLENPNWSEVISFPAAWRQGGIIDLDEEDVSLFCRRL